MSELLAAIFSIAFLAQVLRIAVPYGMAALGGVLSERSGVINLALEGKLLCGALGAAMGAHASGSVFIGMLSGSAAGLAVAALYGLAVIRFRGDQIVCGVAINLLALGLTRFILRLAYNSSSNSPNTPGFTGGLFGNPAFYAVILIGGLVWLVLAKTPWGLRVRASGEHPEALLTAGVSVAKMRWMAVLAAGVLAGLGGGWLAMENSAFTDNISGGRGYIALAAVIMGSWRPLYAAAAALLFATADALQVHLQTSAIGIPSELVQTLPWVLTMVFLAGLIGRSRAPKALGKPLD